MNDAVEAWLEATERVGPKERFSADWLDRLETIDLIVAIGECEESGNHASAGRIDMALRHKLDLRTLGCVRLLSTEWEAWAWRNGIVKPKPVEPNGHYAFLLEPDEDDDGDRYGVVPIAFWHLHHHLDTWVSCKPPPRLCESQEAIYESSMGVEETKRALIAAGFIWLDKPDFDCRLYRRIGGFNASIAFDGVPVPKDLPQDEVQLIPELTRLGILVGSRYDYAVMSPENFAIYSRWKAEEQTCE